MEKVRVKQRKILNEHSWLAPAIHKMKPLRTRHPTSYALTCGVIINLNKLGGKSLGRCEGQSHEHTDEPGLSSREHIGNYQRTMTSSPAHGVREGSQRTANSSAAGVVVSCKIPKVS